MNRNIFAIVSVCLCVAGCGNSPKSFPDDVTRPLANAVAEHQYEQVQALLATSDGKPVNPALIGNLLGNDWNDDGRAASEVLNWSVVPNRPEEQRLAALMLHAIAECIAVCDDKFFRNQGGRLAFAKTNPLIAETLARALARFVPTMFDDSDASAGFGVLEGKYSDINPTKVFIALLADPKSAEAVYAAVDAAVNVWLDKYASSVRDKPRDKDLSMLIYAAEVRGAICKAQRMNHLPEDAHGYFDDIEAQVRTLEALQHNPGGIPGDTSALSSFIDQQTGRLESDRFQGNPGALKEALDRYWRDNQLDSVVSDFLDAARTYRDATQH